MSNVTELPKTDIRLDQDLDDEKTCDGIYLEGCPNPATWLLRTPCHNQTSMFCDTCVETIKLWLVLHAGSSDMDVCDICGAIPCPEPVIVPA